MMLIAQTNKNALFQAFLNRTELREVLTHIHILSCGHIETGTTVRAVVYLRNKNFPKDAVSTKT